MRGKTYTLILAIPVKEAPDRVVREWAEKLPYYWDISEGDELRFIVTIPRTVSPASALHFFRNGKLLKVETHNGR